jgi:CRISPR-associated protein (TIGR03986 family)
MPTSKLFWNAELNQLEVKVLNNKKVEKMWACPIEQLAPNVPRTVSENDNIEVDFDRDPTGKILRVRLAGESWQGETKKETIDYQGIKNRAIEDAKNAKLPYKKGYSDKPKDTHQEIIDMSKDFHNPYNFVPAMPRGSVTGELADREPCGHDRFYPNHLSGKLSVKMTVETPLVVLDTARMSLNASDPKHKQFPVRIENGKPFINPTAVKGMLRSAYEAVTNSRMSVFTKHDERLAFRAEVGEGLFAIPARIEGEKGNEKIVLYTGNSEIDENDGGPKITGYKNNGQPIRQSQFGAWIETYKKRAYEVVNGKNVFAYSNYAVVAEDDNNNFPKHGKKAWAWIEFDDSKRERFTFYKVRKLAYEENLLGNKPNDNCKKVEGFICLTGKNMANKHDERFFFNPTTEIKLEKTHRDSWDSLIKNYRKQHESDFDSPPTDGKGRDEYSLEWSRQINRTTKEEISEKANLVAEELKDKTLCYAKVKKVGTEFEVLELFPVMISRRLHEVSPADLLDENLKPASIIENVKNLDGTIKYNSEMSPADRVFGFVRHKRKDKDGKDIPFKGKIAGYRGQIRFGSVVCNGLLEKDADGKLGLNKDGKVIQDFNNLPLNILGQPKPQQGRFYVAKDNQGIAQERSSDLTNEKAGYKEGKGLRGRKVYPHHNLPENYWITDKDWKSKELAETSKDLTQTLLGGKYFREYIRPKGEKRTDSQNRSIEGWITPQTEFEFDIHFTNLSEVELGALVWLLQLPDEHFHRFGGGKPLGFGSVKLGLESSEITNGEDLKKFYTSLDAKLTTSKTPEICKAEFEKVANQDILNSFKVACKGFDDKLPIHYPRARNYKETTQRNHQRNKNEVVGFEYLDNIPLAPNPEGKSFEWFVENSKEKIGLKDKDGRVLIEEIRPRIVLDNLWEKKLVNGSEVIKEDIGLPILPHKK